MSRPARHAARPRRWPLVVLLGCAVCWVSVAEPVAQPAAVVLVLGGLTQDELEACGCGGRNAGGLARRAAMVRELRAELGDLIHLDAGGLGVREERLDTVARALSMMGVDACGLSGDDLSIYDRLRTSAARHALALTSLAPPPHSAARPPEGLAVGTRAGPPVGVVSVAFGYLSVGDLTERCAAELGRLRGEGCVATVLISHLGATATERLISRLPTDRRPEVVALATGRDEPGPVWRSDGCCWVPLARLGRSLAIVRLARQGDGWQVEAHTELVGDGPRDRAVQRWVDDQYERERAGLGTAEPAGEEGIGVERCAPCHQASVTAWRGHAHARAVTTLEQRRRDVASCLICHSERLRRTGLRPASGGDRGVTCATCHQGLPSHLHDPAQPVPALDETGCEQCHTAANSPGWDPERYRQHVVATCRGEPPAALPGS